MARAVRYMVSRSAVQNHLEPETGKAEVKNAPAKARAIASRAARQAARDADPRVRKSAGKRVAEEVTSEAKRSDIDSPESMKRIGRFARKAAKGR